MNKDEVFHCSVFFSGHVQGVGFRFQTRQVAREFEVSGFVRNLMDGRVQLEVEGEKAEVEGFLREVMDRLDVYIRKTERSEEIRAGRYSGFGIE
ncbi:MAG: acylphosphatase [Oceanipulchritudo sp.]